MRRYHVLIDKLKILDVPPLTWIEDDNINDLEFSMR